MRFEKQTKEHLRVYLTASDLSIRGIAIDTIVGESGQELWRELLETAEAEYGFMPQGAVDLNVTMFPRDGLVIDVQKVDAVVAESDQEQVEIRLTIDVIHHLIYQFDDIEDVINASIRAFPHMQDTDQGGALYHYDGRYYLHFVEVLKPQVEERLAAILSEYGKTTTVSPYLMMEYGKTIQTEQAVKQLYDTFA
ncbi:MULTISPECIES: adaptor protein MecA [unclassified Exiguobacterium]|uniref:adaptor protein MecA n=1 Tax=unclassified Exiguobacterium TaxID=2644629 RepID=UPI0008D3788C|nr:MULTISPECIES: adaptor protein MecA [unclassified Exiguobacterium]OGX77853.1 negative regulator of genetic competence [Exiguobacterium sp. SH31]TCI27380.1 negative regulator of genetic competence [Exiguobacterium sp. SH5S4]TCI45424.1 negative regulator of genetic competence [Exiguobacterium sp. SH5S32]TCI52627.1 negative regulator of genetic competence [Exiguobacterium sp. SH1S4]TCI57911.1 negative regulator of genetic competence [Exiguobacterium sp. SH5S13]